MPILFTFVKENISDKKYVFANPSFGWVLFSPLKILIWFLQTYFLYNFTAP